MKIYLFISRDMEIDVWQILANLSHSFAENGAILRNVCLYHLEWTFHFPLNQEGELSAKFRNEWNNKNES